MKIIEMKLFEFLDKNKENKETVFLSGNIFKNIFKLIDKFSKTVCDSKYRM